MMLLVFNKKLLLEAHVNEMISQAERNPGLLIYVHIISMYILQLYQVLFLPVLGVLLSDLKQEKS